MPLLCSRILVIGVSGSYLIIEECPKFNPGDWDSTTQSATSSTKFNRRRSTRDACSTTASSSPPPKSTSATSTASSNNSARPTPPLPIYKCRSSSSEVIFITAILPGCLLFNAWEQSNKQGGAGQGGRPPQARPCGSKAALRLPLGQRGERAGGRDRQQEGDLPVRPRRPRGHLAAADPPHDRPGVRRAGPRSTARLPRATTAASSPTDRPARARPTPSSAAPRTSPSTPTAKAGASCRACSRSSSGRCRAGRPSGSASSAPTWKFITSKSSTW